MTGSIGGSTTFGAGEGNETTLARPGGFLAKYDGDGFLVWAIETGPVGLGIALDADRNAYLTGSFSGTVTFGADEPNETTLAAAGIDLFLARYDGDGAFT